MAFEATLWLRRALTQEPIHLVTAAAPLVVAAAADVGAAAAAAVAAPAVGTGFAGCTEGSEGQPEVWHHFLVLPWSIQRHDRLGKSTIFALQNSMSDQASHLHNANRDHLVPAASSNEWLAEEALTTQRLTYPCLGQPKSHSLNYHRNQSNTPEAALVPSTAVVLSWWSWVPSCRACLHAFLIPMLGCSPHVDVS